MDKALQKKTLKFFHTISSIGFCAALLALIIMHASLPDPTELQQFASLRITMGNVAKWLLLPSTALVVISGLFAMAFNESYKSAGWAWAKLATGVLVLEGTLVYVQAPMEQAANDMHQALAGEIDLSELGLTLVSEWNSFWVILAVAIVNIAFGVYRPSLIRRK